MKIKQRTEMSMTTYEITVIRSRNASSYCEVCGEMTLHLSLAEMTSVIAMSADEVVQLAKSAQIHHSIDAQGSLRLCGRSAAGIKGST